MPRTARQSTVQVLGALLALGVIVLLVWTTTTAAFIDTTSNDGNVFGTGDVVLSDDDGGSTAAFTVTGLAPGESVTECIVVTYDGSIEGVGELTTVDFYVSGLSGNATLGTDLTVDVAEGDGTSTSVFGDCAAGAVGFSGNGHVISGTLDGLNGDAHGDNPGTWAPSATGESRAYEITVTLDGNPDPASEAGSVTADFVWEVQTTP